jgi:hypothetical protein
MSEIIQKFGATLSHPLTANWSETSDFARIHGYVHIFLKIKLPEKGIMRVKEGLKRGNDRVKKKNKYFEHV